MLKTTVDGFEKGAREQHKVSCLTALAELIHNASDAEASRLEIRVMKTPRTGEDVLLFSDNGLGMDKDELCNMLLPDSHRERSSTETSLYGKGFKTGTLKNAESALVFTARDGMGSMSIGLFSLRCLREEQLDSCPVISLDEHVKGVFCSLAPDVDVTHTSASGPEAVTIADEDTAESASTKPAHDQQFMQLLTAEARFWRP